MLSVTLRWTSIPSRGRRNIPALRYRSWGKLQPDGPHGLNAESGQSLSLKGPFSTLNITTSNVPRNTYRLSHAKGGVECS